VLYKKNMHTLLEKCPIAPDEDIKFVQTCFEEQNIKLPCAVRNILEKKPLKECIDEIMNNSTAVMQEYFEFFFAILRECPDKCILEKMKVLTEDGKLDVTKAVEKLLTYPLIKDSMSAENITLGLEGCLSDEMSKPPEIISFFETFNVTVGCRDTKQYFGCMAMVVSEPIVKCMSGQCQAIMAEEDKNNNTTDSGDDSNKTTRRKRDLKSVFQQFVQVVQETYFE